MAIKGTVVSVGGTTVTLSFGYDSFFIISHDLAIMPGNEGTNVLCTRVRDSQIGFVKELMQQAMFRYSPLNYLVVKFGEIGLDCQTEGGIPPNHPPFPLPSCATLNIFVFKINFVVVSGCF